MSLRSTSVSLRTPQNLYIVAELIFYLPGMNFRAPLSPNASVQSDSAASLCIHLVEKCLGCKSFGQKIKQHIWEILQLPPTWCLALGQSGHR